MIKDTCYKGTRILLGNEKRDLINKMVSKLIIEGYEEISIPILQLQEIFAGKVGEENNNQMYNFKDRRNRDVCLAPEYTSVIMKLAKTHFRDKKDVKLFYVQECFRGEKPQAGRYRQFTQLGVEIINPTKNYMGDLITLSSELLGLIHRNDKITYEIDVEATRGLDYYEEGTGFETTCDELGAQKQVCGGGAYDGGVGFAIGIDRLLLLNQPI